MIGTGGWKQRMPQSHEALPGREQAMAPAQPHHVHGRSLLSRNYPRSEMVLFGMGRFWGAERRFWDLPGVLTTAVGYAGGYTSTPTYDEVRSGRAGHAEVVQVIYDPAQIRLERLLKVFWESHDPTQGMRQGNDVGTPYRSAVYTSNVAQLGIAEASARRCQAELNRAGLHSITTEISVAGPFYYAEDEYQQYLSRNPDGQDGLGGTGVRHPIG
ncbi:peptide-methionine (S)-S-oxide reductase MsrA [Rhodanobacter terrae]|uniref:Peptide methionine sulfoxide reductase MsrA n=1 Tax=Rhodanobacter terrae TaxID=418647 RepID=A0ABW0SXU8_9GAMM